MQPASMLGVGPMQGIRTESSFLPNSQVGVIGGLPRDVNEQQLSQLHQQLLFEQQPVPNQPKMDDLLEQMFSLPSWSDMGVVSRAPWDFSAGNSGIIPSMDSAGGLPGPQRLFTMSLMPSGLTSTSTGSQGLSSQICEVEDNISHPQANKVMQYSFDDSLIATRLQKPGLQDTLDGSAGAAVGQPQVNVRAPTLPQGTQEAAQSSFNAGPVALQMNSGSSGSDGSGCQQPPSDSQSAAWRQSYMGGVLPLPLGVGQAKAETLFPQEVTSNDAHVLGKRALDGDEVVLQARGGPQESLFNTFAGAQVGQQQTARTAGQQSHQQMQAGQGVSMPLYETHTGLAQSQGAVAVVAGTARPRVRARRGQATDPHSIAERLRRERIAERMKGLQELVPNSNKTDKASMLDEIIEYVKFLQLQVKVLSMSRLGSAGAVAPLVADLPAEGHNDFVAATLGRHVGSLGSSQDVMAVAERQVASLMEEDMGSAMQYLQSKGLCLMPLSLATAISSTNPRATAGPQGGEQIPSTGDHPHIGASSSTFVAGSSNTLASRPSASGGDGIGVTKASNEGLRNSKDSMQASVVEKMNGVGSGPPSSATKSGLKNNEEASRRGQ